MLFKYICFCFVMQNTTKRSYDSLTELYDRKNTDGLANAFYERPAIISLLPETFKNKVFVEDVIVNDDNIIVISEMFRKNTNMTPKGIQQTRDLITGKFVGWSDDSNDKVKYTFEIMDFVLFKFNKEGKLEEIKPISKEDYNKITCWNPYASMAGMDLAKALNRMGWFDYGFTEDDGNTEVMVCKNNASPRKPEVFMYTLDKSYAQKKVNLKKQAKLDLDKGKVGYFDVLRNSNGKIAVAYYQPKLQKITIDLESLH